MESNDHIAHKNHLGSHVPQVIESRGNGGKLVHGREICIDELQKEKESEIKRIELEKETALSNISLIDFYIERNKKLIENKKKSISIHMQAELDRISKDKKKQLEIQYKNQIEDEKTDANSRFRMQFEADKAIKIENETIRRYQIYFRPDTAEDKLSNIKKEIEAINAQYLTYDNRAEKAKIDRQEKALNSFMGGYVKNPFLSFSSSES